MRQCHFAKCYIVAACRARILIFSQKEGSAFISTYLSIRLLCDYTITDSKRMRRVSAYRCRYLSALYLALTYVTRECNVREFGTIIARRKSPRERNCISMQAAVICTFTVRRGCKSRCCFACMRVIISRRGARRMGGACKISGHVNNPYRLRERDIHFG